MKEQYAEMPIYFGLAMLKVIAAVRCSPCAVAVTKVRAPGLAQCSRDRLRIEAGQTVAASARAGRKVRAPQSRMPVNGRTPRGDGKCHRKYTADGRASGSGKVEMAR